MTRAELEVVAECLGDLTEVGNGIIAQLMRVADALERAAPPADRDEAIRRLTALLAEAPE
jgi:hypothetical protein